MVALKKVRGAGVEPARQIAGNAQGYCVYQFRQPLKMETVGLEPTALRVDSLEPHLPSPLNLEGTRQPLVPLFYVPLPFRVAVHHVMATQREQREVDHALDALVLGLRRDSFFCDLANLINSFMCAVCESASQKLSERGALALLPHTWKRSLFDFILTKNFCEGFLKINQSLCACSDVSARLLKRVIFFFERFQLAVNLYEQFACRFSNWEFHVAIQHRGFGRLIQPSNCLLSHE